MKTIENKFAKKIINLQRGILILLFSLTSISAFSEVPGSAKSSGVGLNATRLIYLQGESSVSVSARNNTNINYLAKFAVTKNRDGSMSSAPFTVTPPLIKIDSGKVQDVRVFAQSNTLPTDRESVFYFVATMIPATNGPAQGSALNIGYSNVIKLFYRPAKLSMSVSDAFTNLQVKSSSTGLIVANNSPYYISINKLTVNGVKIDLSMKKGNTMIAPYDSFSYIAPTNARKGIAKWVVINDLGGEEEFSGTVN